MPFIKGHSVSEEMRKKIGNKHRGKIVSEETRRKLSHVLTGRKLPNKTIEKMRQAHMGTHLSEDTKKKIAKAHLKSGFIIIGKYLYKYMPNHPFATKQKYVAMHRLIVEEFLGRYLNLSERVHHINGNTLDNRIENLSLFKSNSQHYGFHVRKLTYANAESIRNMYITGNYSQRKLAEIWGIARGSIRCILNGITYKEKIKEQKLIL